MSMGSMEDRTKGIIKQAQELIEQAYQRGYKVGREAGYEDWKNSAFNDVTIDAESFIEQGRNETWKAVKKIYLSIDDGGLPSDEVKKIFGMDYCYDIMTKFSASEAIAKIKAYEQKKQEEDKIEVGDEVRWLKNTDYVGIVTYVDYQNNMIWIMGHDGRHFIGGSHEIEKYEKTGRHFSDMDELIKKMQEGE